MKFDMRHVEATIAGIVFGLVALSFYESYRAMHYIPTQEREWNEGVKIIPSPVQPERPQQREHSPHYRLPTTESADVRRSLLGRRQYEVQGWPEFNYNNNNIKIIPSEFT